MIRPAFETQYDVQPGPASTPLTDATFTTEPPRSIRCGSASCVVRNAPVRLIPSVSSQRSSDSSRSGPLSPTPALFTSASMPPKCPTAARQVLTRRRCRLRRRRPPNASDRIGNRAKSSWLRNAEPDFARLATGPGPDRAGHPPEEAGGAAGNEEHDEHQGDAEDDRIG